MDEDACDDGDNSGGSDCNVFYGGVGNDGDNGDNGDVNDDVCKFQGDRNWYSNNNGNVMVMVMTVMVIMLIVMIMVMVIRQWWW